MRHPAIASARLPVLLILLCAVAGCGGGGGSSSATPAPPKGSVAIAEVDADHDGLIEIANLEQLNWIRNNERGTSLIDTDKQVNSKGCPGTGCFGYELVVDLNFDTNADGIMDARDAYFDVEKDGKNSGWVPIYGFSAVLEGNGHHIRNLYIKRETVDYIGLFASITSDSANAVAIRNLNFDGPLTSISGYGGVGALVGRMSIGGQTELKNITMTGSVSGIGNWIGGIAGLVEVAGGALTFNSNSTAAKVTGTSGVAGGAIGTVWDQLLDVGNSNLIFRNNISTADVTGEGAGGLFGALVTAAPTLVEANIISGVVIGHDYGAGGLASFAGGQHLVIRDTNSSAPVINNIAPSLVGQGAGGLIGSFGGGLIEKSTVTGDVIGRTQLGGLIGTIKGPATVRQNRALGKVQGDTSSFVSQGSNVYGGFNGGLVGLIQFNSPIICRIEQNYSAGSVSGGSQTGGLIGYIDARESSSVTVINNFSTSPVTASQYAGALIGAITAINSTVGIFQNLALGRTFVGTLPLPTFAGGLVAEIRFTSGASVDLAYNQWASDSTGRSLSVYAAQSGFSEAGVSKATVAELGCPLSANNISCRSSELFHGWDTGLNADGNPIWDFGNTAQLPGLRIGNTIYRPLYNSADFSISAEAI